MVVGEIFTVLAYTAQLFSYLLLIRVLLTWFPGIDWNNGVLSALSSITDPYLNIFRGVIPPIGGFDISSLLAFFLLNFIGNPPIFVILIIIIDIFIIYNAIDRKVSYIKDKKWKIIYVYMTMY